MNGRHRVETVAWGAPLIELDQVGKTFHSDTLAVEVLRGITLTLRRGEFVAIMGASGSGKSTLMNLIGCLDRPTTGSYRFAGQEVGALGRDQLALLRRDAFGFIFQQYNLLPTANALENVEAPAIYAGLKREARLARARALLASLGLGDRLHHRPSQLSGGQQQRVSIARALMNGGGVILADEPTGALDSRSGREVMALLRQLNQAGHTVVLITHDAGVASQANRIITLTDGGVVSDSGPAPLPAPPAVAPAPTAAGGSWSTDLAEAVKMAWRSLGANLFRTILTLLGIVIGVGSVVAMLALGDGAKAEVLNRIQAMGADLLVIRPGGANLRGSGAAVATLTALDSAEIARLPNVAVSVPEMGAAVTLRYAGADYQTSVTMTSPDYPLARKWPTSHGLFFDAADLRGHAPVVALGQTVVDNLFPPGQDPVGQYVLINNVPFHVIGVLARKGASNYGTDLDDAAFVPLTTGQLRLQGQRHLRAITVQVEETALMNDTQERITELLLARHQTRDFLIRNMAAVLETATQTQNTMTTLLGSIAAISLLVGGIGVMNIMLVSVTERTREIGIRMATGARTTNILLQFITEALVVCAIGGLIGVAGGVGAALIAQSFGSVALFSPPPMLMAFGCAFATGLLFGFMPARKAAHLDPVTALAAE